MSVNFRLDSLISDIARHDKPSSLFLSMNAQAIVYNRIAGRLESFNFPVETSELNIHWI